MFFFLLFLSSAFSQTLTVYIDPGHGGSQDTGAISFYKNQKESQINLQIARHLFERLKKQTHFHPHLLRNKDAFLPIFDRIISRTTNNHSEAVFLSLHANFSYNSKKKGVEFYIDTSEARFYFTKNTLLEIVRKLKRVEKIKKSTLLARSLIKEWRSSHTLPPLKQAPLYVLSYNHIPSVMIEMGYLSHKKEALKLISKTYQKKLAVFIHKGLERYRQRLDKQK